MRRELQPVNNYIYHTSLYIPNKKCVQIRELQATIYHTALSATKCVQEVSYTYSLDRHALRFTQHGPWTEFAPKQLQLVNVYHSA